MNAVQCDYCGKFAPNPVSAEYLVGRYTTKVPEGWYIANAWNGDADSARSADLTGEFCSLDCVSEFFHDKHREKRS